jgi:hypothetical protein
VLDAFLDWYRSNATLTACTAEQVDRNFLDSDSEDEEAPVPILSPNEAATAAALASYKAKR